MCLFPFFVYSYSGLLICMSGVVQILVRVAWVKIMTSVSWVHKILACMARVL